MAISIGNSGFEYTKGAKEIIGGSKKCGRHYGTKCTVINSKTGVSIFSIMGGIRYNPYGNPFTGSRKFLGMDNKYYYIQIGSNSNVD